MEELWRDNNRGRAQGFLQWKKDKHELGVGSLVHKDIVNTVMGRQPVSYAAVEEDGTSRLVIEVFDDLDKGEHCHGMSPSLQQAHHYPPEGSSFRRHDRTSIRPNIRLR